MTQLQKKQGATPTGMLKPKELAALKARGGDRRSAILTAEVEYDTPKEFADEIATLWGEARRHFILIGRYLRRVREKFYRDVEQAWMSWCREALPFSYQVAHMMLTVSEKVDDGTFKAEELPVGYSVAYQIVTLPPKVVDEARRRGLIDPNVRRANLLAFKTEIREPRKPKRPPSVEREIAALEDKRAKLEARIREIDNRLHELRGGGVTLDLTATAVSEGD